MRLDSQAKILIELLKTGSVAASRLGRRHRTLLRPLFAGGVLREQRSGAGICVSVTRPETLATFIRQQFPAAFDLELPALPARAAAILQRRDAKAARCGGREPVFIRGRAGATLTHGDTVLQVAELTDRAGCTALTLDDVTFWSCTSTVAIIENEEVFCYFEIHPIDADIAVLAHGCMSERLLRWLAHPAMAGATYVHCGDYDPVGLSEYLRLRDACPGRVQLFVPNDLAGLMRRFGKNDLLDNEHAKASLRRLRGSDDASVRGVVALIDELGVGLEQESLVVPNRAP
jgi:hypothetical protein